MDSIKCTLIGDDEIGKTCMLTSYASEVQDYTPGEYIPTVFDSYSHLVKIDGRQIRLELYDTSGKEFYDDLIPLSYDNTQVFLICFSVMNCKSFENVEHKWYPAVRKNCPSATIILIGTKCDMRNDNNEASMNKLQIISNDKVITHCKGLEMAKKICAVKYFECSALTRVGLAEVFEAVVKSVLLPLKTVDDSNEMTVEEELKCVHAKTQEFLDTLDWI